MKKRISALLILFVFILSCLPVFGSNTGSNNDNKYGEFMEICSFFKELGVIDKDKDYNSNDLVTRAEYARLIKRIVNHNYLMSTEWMPVFTDVGADHPYSSDIMALYNMGYVNGNNNMFSPDSEIEFCDALHILLKVLGYGEYAEYKGGYTFGDYVVARSIDISVSDESSEYGRIFSLIMQALETKMLDAVGFSSNRIDYDNSNSDTMLKRFFDIKFDDGVLESDEITSLPGISRPRTGEVVVDGMKFSIAFECSFLAGTLVRYYYSEDSAENKKLVFLAEADKSDILTYTASEIDKFSDMTYSIWENGKRKKIYLKNGVTIICNGKIVTEFDEKKMTPSDGYVSFIDNDGDGEYDVVHVMEYISFVAKSVVESDDCVTIYADSKLNIKPIRIETDNDVHNSIYGPKGFTSISKIQPGVIVSAFCNDETTYQICRRIYISNTVFTGNIETVENSNDELRYIINGKEYSLVNTYKNYVSLPQKPLESVTIYLNHEGKIAEINLKESGDMSLGYLIDAALTDEALNSDVLYIKAFCEIGKVVTYKIADKVTVDGVRIKSNVGPLIDAMLRNSNGEIENQLFRYSVNSDKEINKLDLYETITSSSEEHADNNLFKVLSQTSLYYKKTSKSFSNRVKIDDSTKIFVIPNDIKNAEENEYTMTNADWLKSDGRYYVEAYSTDINSMITDALVVKYNLNDFPVYYHPSVVKDVFGCKNSNGDVTVGITIENDQSELKLTAAASDVVNRARSINTSDLNEYKVDEGDVIKYVLNPLGEISAIQVIYKYSTDKILNTLQANPSTVFNNGRVLKGYVYNVNGDLISIAFEDLSGCAPEYVVSAEDREVYIASDFKIICVNKGRNGLCFEDGSVSDLKSLKNSGIASEVILCTDNGNGKLMIVLE